jgi:hypothetical protein
MMRMGVFVFCGSSIAFSLDERSEDEQSRVERTKYYNKEESE